MRRSAIAMLVAGCGGAAPTPERAAPPPREDKCAQHDYSPHGTRADYVAPVIDDIVIAEPQVCYGNAYIRVSRTHGSRKLDIGGAPDCVKLPPDTDGSCKTLYAVALLAPIEDKLRALHVEISAHAGLGPCGTTTAGYDGWNLSVCVLDWHDAATAIRLVAGELARYDIAGHAGIAVSGIGCSSDPVQVL